MFCPLKLSGMLPRSVDSTMTGATLVGEAKGAVVAGGLAKGIGYLNLKPVVALFPDNPF